jgi:CDP-paratose 2-epimerase
MRIFVTGGAGFVGSNLSLILQATFPAAEIVAMDNLYRCGSELNIPRLEKIGVKFHRGDVRDANSFPSGAFRLLKF